MLQMQVVVIYRKHCEEIRDQTSRNKGTNIVGMMKDARKGRHVLTNVSLAIENLVANKEHMKFHAKSMSCDT